MNPDWIEINNLLCEYHKLGIPQLHDYNKFYMYSIIAHSTAIEGSTLTELETQILLDDGLTAKGKPLEHHLMSVDLKSAYEFAFEQASKKQDITPKFLCQLNANVMKTTGAEHNHITGSWDSSKGEYRLCGVTAGFSGSSYMHFKKIPNAVDELCKELNSLISSRLNKYRAYETSFIAHQKLVTIHPWIDGNGRTSRLLMNYIQYSHNLIPSKVFMEDKKEYIESLQKSRELENPIPFLKFMRQQLHKTLKTEIQEFKKAQKKIDISSKRKIDFGLNF